ncbi:DNA-processing protein DprA [Cryobacterium sp. CG_9.6]|uniref:DNA-processing protein DprA n=1 Tax=Cryobacterium sp. CG_9.6 TaxID=2760710 RepID=UPI002473F426|nr:DNA-processing protein DprA [Cryobacterium sp. CG_9.6]MDH6237484.1 DNA processing protein [Cryobacterium sp. CG_9.6]
MSIFGLPDQQVRALATPVRSDETTDAGVPAPWAEIFARAAWTGIAEPGDGLAGLVVNSLGATTGLTAVLEGWAPARVAAVLIDAGYDDSEDELGTRLDQGLLRWRPRLNSVEVERSLAQAARVGARLLLPTDALWPRSLNDLLAHTPLALWWRGTEAALASIPQSIALVGARAATGYGEHVAMEAAAGLVDRGFTIVSGAAYGIDGTAHRTALASHGSTVAFLAGGVDRFYPAGHDGLLAKIATDGAVLSELACGSAPTKWRFLQRNRLIAAASLATVVLEAGWRSGSLNTASHAATLGRPLGAVPGPVTSPTSAGCHRLIREFDAVCVTTAAEMAELVGERSVQVPLDYAEADGSTSDPEARTSDQVRVFDALSGRLPRPLPDIARRAGLSTSAVRAALGALDVDGVVGERGAGWVRLH